MTSMKLTICLLASMVMRRPLCLNMRHISFLVCSVIFGVAFDIDASSLIFQLLYA